MVTRGGKIKRALIAYILSTELPISYENRLRYMTYVEVIACERSVSCVTQCTWTSIAVAIYTLKVGIGIGKGSPDFQ